MTTLVTGFAQTPQSAEGKRFLFIIDASTSMKPLEMPMRETLFDLIYSGARGNLTNGDTFGVWIAGEKNDTSFPMEVWKQKFVVEIAAKAVSHMKDHGFKTGARLDLALADALRVVKNVGDLTIVIVSNGETPISGTPFDAAINARFQELAPRMKLAKATLNTTLVAQDGEIVAWSANSPEFLLDVPYVAPKPKRKVELARSTGSTATATQQVSKPAPVPQKPKITANPIIITKDTVAQERRAYLRSAYTTTNTETTAHQVAVATNAIAAAHAVTNQTNVLTAKAEAPTNAVATKPTTNSTATTAPEPTVAAVAPEPPQKIVAVESPVAAESERTTNWGFVLLCVGSGAAGAFLVSLAVLLGLRVRRLNREPSLISQALARERLSQS